MQRCDTQFNIETISIHFISLIHSLDNAVTHPCLNLFAIIEETEWGCAAAFFMLKT